jgi:hypothetical protein
MKSLTTILVSAALGAGMLAFLARRRRSCAPAMFAGTPTSATSIRPERMSPFTRTTGVGGLTSASRFVSTEAEATGPATSGPNFNRTRPTCTPRPLNRAASFFDSASRNSWTSGDERGPARRASLHRYCYCCFLAPHLLSLSIQTPPAFSQSALVFASVIAAN